MKLLTASVAGWLALLGLLLPWLLGTATATPTPPPEDDRPLFREGSGFYRTCESLMGGGDGLVTLTPGVATILRAISCDTPSVRRRVLCMVAASLGFFSPSDRLSPGWLKAASHPPAL